MAEYHTLDVEGSPMRVCAAAPQAPGPYPLVVVMCHIGGLDAFTADRVDRLAAAGFAAVAPDVFHHHPWIEQRDARRASLRDRRIVHDIRASIAHAHTAFAVDRERIAILGHCMGGRTALLGAGSVPEIGPLVMYYGGRTMLSWGEDGPTPFDLIAQVRGPVLGFFGNDDSEPSPADVDRIEAEFAAHGIACEFHRYDGAGHAFQNFMSPERYREQPARESWARTLEFLTQSL